MKKNFQRMLIVCVLAGMILGTGFIPGLNAAYISKPLDSDVKSSSTVFSSDTIKISVQEDEDLITIQYHLNEFSTEEITIDEIEYKQIKLDDESNTIILSFLDLLEKIFPRLFSFLNDLR